MPIGPDGSQAVGLLHAILASEEELVEVEMVHLPTDSPEKDSRGMASFP